MAAAADEAARGAVRKAVFELGLPAEEGGGRALVKIYPRRPKHGILRRLRTGRAAREGRGYVEFAKRGLQTPRLLVWGERRRLGLLELGFLATGKLDGKTLNESYRARRDDALLESALRVLRKIHAAGLCHGDPFARNFLVTASGPIPFDFGSWGRVTVGRLRRDLARFLASVLVLTGETEPAARLIESYASRGGRLPDPKTELLRVAEAVAEETGRA